MTFANTNILWAVALLCFRRTMDKSSLLCPVILLGVLVMFAVIGSHKMTGAFLSALTSNVNEPSFHRVSVCFALISAVCR